MELQRIIYAALTGSTEVVSYTGNRIYHKHLPPDFSINNITSVFILNAKSTEGSFDNSNEIEIWNLNLKLNYVRTGELYEYAEVIKNLILNINNNNIKYVEFNDDNLVWNFNYEFYNLNLNFTIHYEK